MGELAGPVVGQALYQWIGYEWTITAVSGGIIVVGTAFLIWGGVFEKETTI